MKSRSLLLSWLLAACLLGMNGFQAYWLVSTYRLTRTQFYRGIHEALVAAVQQQLLADVWAPQTPRFDLHVAGTSVVQISSRRRLLRAPTVTVLPGQEAQRAARTSSRPPDHITLDDWSSGRRVRLAGLTHAYRQQLHQRGIDSAAAGLDTFSLRRMPRVFVPAAQSPIFTPQRTPPVLLSPAYGLYAQARALPPTPYLWQRLGGLLGGSALLLVLTGSCFVLVWYTLRAQRQLAEVKNDFINNMTHELKTPLATIAAAVETLDRFGLRADPQKARTYLGIARTELRRLADLVDKVLTIATEEQAQLVLHPELVKPAELVQAAMGRHQLQADKPVHFQVAMASNEVIRADRFHLEGAINNLLDNAIKYSTDSVNIQVSSRRAAGGWQLTVQDDGIGIARSDQAAVFDRFFRVPTGNLHPVKGFGLGLYYVRQVAERHGGHVAVRSEPGQGSAFTLWLPAV
ncbi:sensor histidine kinase [Hymenobacter sublimis]|uniref:histidine kinase n=1 Tax=Hymenobacter sublimis TaxID=2933777 RepID=A0ABY4JFQ4_9BACT|nr:HAMP domain-containing sensor histidine kinase [Hymenobacter sublimis]UPL50189.1 HAMP domain-containing histidine kinase [Hymenobacter sublimis]